jgi:hypothetical protein
MPDSKDKLPLIDDIESVQRDTEEALKGLRVVLAIIVVCFIGAVCGLIYFT